MEGKNRVGIGQVFSVKSADLVGTSPLNSKAISKAISDAITCFFGKDVLGTPASLFINTQSRVLIKPNWVHHINQSGSETACLYTTQQFVLESLRHVIQARPLSILIGDAPIQSCNFEEIVTSEFRSSVARLAAEYEIPVAIQDFRLTKSTDGRLSENVLKDCHPIESYILFDLAADSLLEPVTSPNHNFRVTNYDPRKLAEKHAPGRHQYLICREAIECDVVLSLPKLKTHRKAGITGALKNLVGVNGNKDYLPHHRVGSPTENGDCYSTPSLANRLFERFIDKANCYIGSKWYDRWCRIAHLFGGGLSDLPKGGLEGGWHGNDTVWRMALDLNRILLYGQPNGCISEVPQRKIFSLTDAIMCGEGEGPLAPSPRSLGLVSFSDSQPAADYIHAKLMGFDPHRIPIVRESFSSFRWPLCDSSAVPIAVFKEREVKHSELLTRLGANFLPPKGWAGFIEDSSEINMRQA